MSRRGTRAQRAAQETSIGWQKLRAAEWVLFGVAAQQAADAMRGLADTIPRAAAALTQVAYDVAVEDVVRNVHALDRGAS